MPDPSSSGCLAPADRRRDGFAIRNRGQRIAVMPSERLVVVRLTRAHLRYGDAAGFERLVVDTLRALHPEP